MLVEVINGRKSMTLSLDSFIGPEKTERSSLDMVELAILKILILDYEIKHQDKEPFIKIIERKKAQLENLHNEYKGLIKKIKKADIAALEQEMKGLEQDFLKRMRPFNSVAQAHSAGYLELRLKKAAAFIKVKKKYTEFIAINELSEEEKQRLLIQLLLKERIHAS